jgi:hypothetical protein
LFRQQSEQTIVSRNEIVSFRPDSQTEAHPIYGVPSIALASRNC